MVQKRLGAIALLDQGSGSGRCSLQASAVTVAVTASVCNQSTHCSDTQQVKISEASSGLDSEALSLVGLNIKISKSTSIILMIASSLNSWLTAAGRRWVNFPTVEGDVSEVIHIDELHLLNLWVILSEDIPHHLADQQDGVMVSSYVVVHLPRETVRDNVLSFPDGCCENFSMLESCGWGRKT